MRLRQIQVTNTPPIRQFLADQLSDTVVFAGPNGAGKTRLVGALPQFFQNPMAGIGPNGAVGLIIDAANNSERTEWQKSTLDTRVPDDVLLNGSKI
jgi:predicted ATP-binding protein involved in virulence